MAPVQAATPSPFRRATGSFVPARVIPVRVLLGTVVAILRHANAAIGLDGTHNFRAC
jgi:hypothetical protein